MDNTTPCQPIGNTDDGQYLGALTKKCTKCGEAKALDDYSVNSNAPDGRAYACKPCARARSKEYYQERLKGLRASARDADPEGYQEKRKDGYVRGMPKRRAWLAENHEVNLQKKRSRIANLDDQKAVKYLEKAKLQMRSWREKNLEHHRAWMRGWAQKNKDKVRLYSSNRRLKKRTPSWADMGAIERVYAEAKRIEDATGIPYDVDHIYPLRGKSVWGLHVAENLRPFPSRENGSKLNKLPGSEANELWNPRGKDVYYPESNACSTTSH